MSGKTERTKVAVIAGGTVSSLLAALHALAPGVRDKDAFDAIEKDDEAMRLAATLSPPKPKRRK